MAEEIANIGSLELTRTDIEAASKILACKVLPAKNYCYINEIIAWPRDPDMSTNPKKIEYLKSLLDIKPIQPLNQKDPDEGVVGNLYRHDRVYRYHPFQRYSAHIHVHITGLCYISKSGKLLNEYKGLKPVARKLNGRRPLFKDYEHRKFITLKLKTFAKQKRESEWINMTVVTNDQDIDGMRLELKLSPKQLLEYFR